MPRYHGSVLGNVGPLEVLVLIVALALFGPKRLPELGSSLGRAVREFRDSLSGEQPDEGGGAAQRLQSSSTVTGNAAGRPEREALSCKRA